MRRVALVTAASSALSILAFPAFAQDGGFYISGELGAVISSETDQVFTPGTLAGSTGKISTEHDLGFSAAASVGYDFGAFRIEAEAGHISADVDKVTSSFSVGSGLTAGSQSASGEISARTLMANASVDFAGFDDFTFFAGGGAGVAKLKASIRLSGGTTLLDDEDSDWRFAWQGFIGVRKPLTSNIDAHVRYRYFTVDDAEMIGLGGRVVEPELTSHSIAAGVTFKF